MAIANVDTQHPLYRQFQPEYKLVSRCVRGQREIVKHATEYVPRPEGWSDARFRNFLMRGCFMNATARTLQALIGIAFAKAPAVQISGFDYLIEDCNGKGQHISLLARDLLSETLKTARCGIFTDYTGMVEDGEQKVATQGRVVLRAFMAEQIINWRVVDGRLKLLVLKYTEQTETADDDFENYFVTKWIELRMVDGVCHYRIWKFSISNPLGSGMLVGSEATQVTELTPMRDKGGAGLDHIPWSWCGSENNDEIPDIPPLGDISYLNIGHFIADLDMCDAACIAGQPTIAVAGLTEAWASKFYKNGVKIGGQEGLLLPEGGSLEIVQAQETNASSKICEVRETQMAKLGARIIERQAGTRTATQATGEAQTDNSILAQCAGNVEMCINRALVEAENFVTSGVGSITINKVYTPATFDSQGLVTIMAAVQSNLVTIEDFVRWTQNASIADSNETVEMIIGRLNAQKEMSSGVGGGVDDNDQIS